jgi:hypothetical protein
MSSPLGVVVALVSLSTHVFLARSTLDPSLLVAPIEQKTFRIHKTKALTTNFFVCYEETLIDEGDYKL